MKIVVKEHMKKEKKEEEVKIERDVLVCASHQSIIRLFYSFRDKPNLYFIIEYAPNGSLSELLKAYGNKLPLPIAKHYTAEIVNVLQYLHSKEIAHRDLKPENIMLSENFHVKLADFGTAKFMTKQVVSGQVVKHKGYAFVGSPEYVSPEVLSDKESTPSCDLWALGCMIYQFFVGRPPFSNKTEYLIFESILKVSYKFPVEVPQEVVDLCQKLLIADPTQRLGSGPAGSPLSYEELKKHKFFEGVNFNDITDVEINIDRKIIERLHEEKKSAVDIDDDLESNGSGDDEEVKRPQTSRIPRSEMVPKIIKEGIIEKKCGWIFYKKRKVVLTTKPQILYYEPDKNIQKGDIALTRIVKAVYVSGKRFNVVIPKRTYKFEGKTPQEAKEWVKEINDTIRM